MAYEFARRGGEPRWDTCEAAPLPERTLLLLPRIRRITHTPDVRTARAAGEPTASRGGGSESKRRRADDVRAISEGMNHWRGGNDLGAPTEQSQLLHRTGTRRYYTLFITHFGGDMMTLPRSGANVNIV